MAADYRNPATPPFDTEDLVHAYNGCLANQAVFFAVGPMECAMELISCPGLRGNGLINNLTLRAGFMTTFVESGVCWGCFQPQEKVWFCLVNVVLLL